MPNPQKSKAAEKRERKRKKNLSSTDSAESPSPARAPLLQKPTHPMMNTEEIIRESLDSVYSPPPTLHPQYGPEFITPTGQYQVPYAPNNGNISQHTPVQDSSSAILAKLDNIERKLMKLDFIETELGDIKARVVGLEMKAHEIDVLKENVAKVEQSTAFVSDSFDDMRKSHYEMETKMKVVMGKLRSLDDLQEEQVRLREALIDQRTRSMRDNLIFTNIPEAPLDESDTAARNNFEDSEAIIRKFILDDLELESKDMKFKRVHRIGKRRAPNAKPRPIIAKFIFTKERDAVKRNGYKLKDKSFGVSEQFPEEINTYRREVLLPLLREAKKGRYRASMVVDKLYIEGKLQTAVVKPPYRASPRPYRMFTPGESTAPYSAPSRPYQRTVTSTGTTVSLE